MRTVSGADALPDASGGASNPRLAARALWMLDHGKVEEAREALVQLSSSSDASPRPAEEIAHDLRWTAAGCSIGIDRVDNTGAAGRPPWSWFKEPEGESFTVFLDGVRVAIERHPEQLAAATTCMRSPVGPILWIDGELNDVARGPAEKSADDGARRHFLVSALRSASARQQANERVITRLISWAAGIGMNQREIGRVIDRPQTHVFRKIREAADDPTILMLDPREIFNNYLAGSIDRRELIELLTAYPYERGSLPADAPEWGYIPGSWDQLTQLAIEGHISEEELQVIVAGSQALAALND